LTKSIDNKWFKYIHTPTTYLGLMNYWLEFGNKSTKPLTIITLFWFVNHTTIDTRTRYKYLIYRIKKCRPPFKWKRTTAPAYVWYAFMLCDRASLYFHYFSHRFKLPNFFINLETARGSESEILITPLSHPNQFNCITCGIKKSLYTVITGYIKY